MSSFPTDDLWVCCSDKMKKKFRLCHWLLVAAKEGFFYGKKRKYAKAMPKCISLHPFQDAFVAFSNSQGLQNVTCLLVDNWSLVHAVNLCATMTTGCWLLPRRVLAPPPFWGWGYFEVIYNKLHSFMPFIYMQTGVNWQEKEKEIVALKLLKWFTTRGVLRDVQISIFVCPGPGLDVWTAGLGGGRGWG